MKGLVRISTYAKLVGCSRQNIHELIKNSKLTPIVIDGTIFLMAPENNFLDNKQVKAKTKK